MYAGCWRSWFECPASACESGRLLDGWFRKQTRALVADDDVDAAAAAAAAADTDTNREQGAPKKLATSTSYGYQS